MPVRKPKGDVPQQIPDDLAAELVPDPSKLPDVVVLRGYSGKSNRAGFTRIYVDVTFSEFFEVADADVLARRSVADQDALGGSMLWVKREATLLRANVCLAHEHAAFLTGEITARALARSKIEVAAGRRLSDVAVLRGGPTDHLYYSTCRGPNCEGSVPDRRPPTGRLCQV